ncbi:MAG TPA: hypothetical protein VD884_13410 [Ohtaekwangia sp.]|nr:hypothetical protein [Ohtaekwangia sp.]
MNTTEQRSEKEAKLKAMREAQKRLTWIENVKRVSNLTQEQAEAAWTRIFNPPNP